MRAIRELEARYFRNMDMLDWEATKDVFTAGAVMDMRGARDELEASGVPTDSDSLSIVNRDTIVPVMQKPLAGPVTVHHGHMPEIQFVSDDEATGIWPMEDRIKFPENSPVRCFQGFGHYIETYVREEDGRWRIKHLRLTRLLVEID